MFHHHFVTNILVKKFDTIHKIWYIQNEQNTCACKYLFAHQYGYKMMNGKDELKIEIQYAKEKNGDRYTPIEIRMLCGDEVIYASAIYAPHSFDIPKNMERACSVAPGLSQIREDLKTSHLPIAV